MAAKAHARREIRGRRRWRVVAIGAAVTIVAGGGAAGIAYALSGSSGATSAHDASSPSTTVKAPSTKLNIQPTDGATDLPLNGVVTVTADIGRLTSVQVTLAGATGTATASAAVAGSSDLAGALDTNGQMWQSTGALRPHTQYTVTAQAVSPSGQPVEQVSHFGTLAPRAVLGVTLWPSDGLTVGVGMPIALRFDHAVKNKDAILSRLQVTESTPVAGGWHWFSDRELHFRPEQYWPT
ncbi:MAG TPA: Ig-like domain-containing protein, partial [Acidimicrobiales bacterium]|nr:Ig-like domain-containing protein [Acidimicrobiales bacterium]